MHIMAKLNQIPSFEALGLLIRNAFSFTTSFRAYINWLRKECPYLNINNRSCETFCLYTIQGEQWMLIELTGREVAEDNQFRTMITLRILKPNFKL